MKHLLVLLVLGLALASAETARSYNGYRLLRVVPRDHHEAAALHGLSSWHGVDMWNRRATPGTEVTLMVAPGSLRRVEGRLRELDLAHSVGIEDVQSMLDREAREQSLARSANKLGADDTTSALVFDRYMRYDEIIQALKNLEKAHSTVSLKEIGKSVEGRTMYAVRISPIRPENAGKGRRSIVVDAGIHAREWIAPATALYLIEQLVSNKDWQEEVANMDWYIIPNVNPDGYEYTHTTDRFWRKNKGAKRDAYWLRWFWNLLCYPGADLNRNFGFHWAEEGASSMPCSETFAGDSAFSEIESQNLRDFILDLAKDQKVVMYLTLHSYGPMILYPWGYSRWAKSPADVKELADIANEANEAMIKAGSVPFDVMNSADLYAAAGGSDDWAKGVAGIEKSYTLELHGGGSQGFDLPPSKILGSVTTTMAGLKVFADRAIKLAV